jgi:cytochrome c oxidase subunit II
MLDLLNLKALSLLGDAASAEPLPEGVWMPPEASTYASDVDGLYMFILYLCTVFFIAMMGAMVYFAVKYRRRSAEDRTSPIHHSFKIEFLWSAIPTVLLMWIFAWGQMDFAQLQTPPGDSLDLRVTGQKWHWTFKYPKLEKECSQGDPVVVDGVMVPRPPKIVVPLGQPVKVTLSSADVLHSLWIPAFRTKKDALPNRYSGYWFEATMEGTFDIYCAEYCGQDHSVMTAKVKVVPQETFDIWTAGGTTFDKKEDYEKWLRDNDLDDCAAVKDTDGKGLFRKYQCASCHYIDRDAVKVGPSLKGIWRRTESLDDGTTVEITGPEGETYLADSILYPNKHIVKGHDKPSKMNAFQLNSQQLDSIIDYLKTLK